MGDLQREAYAKAWADEAAAERREKLKRRAGYGSAIVIAIMFVLSVIVVGADVVTFIWSGEASIRGAK